MQYRYTNLKKYDLCPYRCFREGFMGEDEETGPKDIGSICHKALELYLTGQETNIYKAADKAKNLLADEIKEYEDDEANQKDIGILLSNARKIFKHVQCPGIEVEKTIFLSVVGDDTLQFQSTIDIIDAPRKKIWDWKTGYLKSDPMQLKVYAYNCKCNGIEIEEATFIYLRDKTIKTIKITPETHKEAEEFVTRYVKEIEAKSEDLVFGAKPEDLFPKTKNVHCKTCPFIEECVQEQYKSQELEEAYVKEASEDSVGHKEKPGVASNEDAKALGLEILRLEGLINKYKDTLKDYCKNNGEVICENKVWGFSPSFSWSFSPDGLKNLAIAILDEEGKNPWELLTLGSKNVKKLNWPEDKLAQFGVAKTTNSFKCVTIDN